MQARGRGRPVGGHQGARELRQGAKRGLEQLAAALRLCVRRVRQRQGRGFVAAGASTRTWVHQLQRSLRGIDATGNRVGLDLQRRRRERDQEPDGSFYRVGQPISNIASQNQADPNDLAAHRAVSSIPRLRPLHATACVWLVARADDGARSSRPTTCGTRDVTSTRGRGSTRVPWASHRRPGAWRLSGLNRTRRALERRRASARATTRRSSSLQAPDVTKGFDLTASYTYAHAKSTIGNASDELNVSNLQDAELLYDTRGCLVRRPHRRQACKEPLPWCGRLPRGLHRVAVSSLFRSALPVATYEGIDLNGNGEFD